MQISLLRGIYSLCERSDKYKRSISDYDCEKPKFQNSVGRPIAILAGIRPKSLIRKAR